METNNPNISEKDRNSILNHIINCANCALQDKDVFQKAMLELATNLRYIFDSEYCSIGIIDGDHAEECVISLEKFEEEEQSRQQEIFLEAIKRVHLDNNTPICPALQSNKSIFQSLLEENDKFNIFEQYQQILISGKVNNSIVIPIRDSNSNNFGFIQFINTKKSIDYEQDILPYQDALLGLVQIIINNQKNQQELAKKENLLKDAYFYNLMQDKRDNVDELLDSIMEYFSEQFNAAVISFRLPVFNNNSEDPIFYLRHVFISPSIDTTDREELNKVYHNQRLLKTRKEMTGIEKLKFSAHGECILSKSEDSFIFEEFGLSLYENILVLPIFREVDQLCTYNARSTKNSFCNSNESPNCSEPFKRLYGTIQLRISKTSLCDSNNEYRIELSETKRRLSYLSKQISLLLNSIVNRFENGLLQVFQEELRNSSFIKIKEFDERCVEIIKNSVHAKVCSIYRYDDLTKLLTLNATTAKKILYYNYSMKKENILEKCSTHKDASNNVLSRAYKAKQPIILFDITDPNIHQSVFIETIDDHPDDNNKTAIVIPMLKKDGTCAGVVLLIGKKKHNHSISTAFWEYDIELIKFIVNVLTRISESDTERLTFLSQLSHELLSPVTQLVYDNDYTVNKAEKYPEQFSRDILISKIRENIDRNMLFKYIISDTEFIYSSGGRRSIDYNIVKQDRPQRILLDAIRLMEKDAMAKGLSIRSYISNMPALYFDKERMMQVFLNLLKNAIRYSDQYTTIGIFYKKRDDGFHEIDFANQGIGIMEEEKETIFELFHRGEAAKQKFTRGTGMGLYIVRDIMRAHGGDCYVRRLNNPTEFVITLPNKE